MMTDGASEIVTVPLIKREIETNFSSLSSSQPTLYSMSKILSSNNEYCETKIKLCEPQNEYSGNKVFNDIPPCSPDSPDHQYCSSTTHPLDPILAHVDNLVSHKEEEDTPRRLCLVCGDIASGFHYGVASCEACKAFFKRTIQGNIEYTCPAANDCEINKRRRKACQACRFQKCLQKGMLKEGVRLDRVRGGRQKYRRNTEVPYTLSFSQKKPTVEDNKILEALVGCEPELLNVPERDSSQTAISTLNILSNLYDKELVNIIGWAKQIPGFTDLSLNNQMRLLQSTWTEILTLALAFRSLPPSGKLMFAIDFFLDEVQAQECGASELYQLCVSIMERLQRCLISRDEFILLKALVLANSDVQLDEAIPLKQFRDSIINALIECVTMIRGSSCETANILLCLPILRQADGVLRKFWLNIRENGTVVMNKLFVEMLDPSMR